MSPAPDSPTLHLLSGRAFVLALAAVLALFAGLNPVWRPLDMAAMDRNILWSYAPIPLLAAGLLALERKLRWSSWMLDTLRLGLAKFAVTYLYVNVVWPYVVEPPAPPLPAPAAPVAQRARFDLHEPPPATPLDPAACGRLEGVALDAAGAPASGVLVAVTGGLEGRVFAPRPEGVRLEHDGRSLRPARAVLLVHERLVLRGEAERLHAVRARDAEGRLLFNLPLGPGAVQELMFERPGAHVSLACTVHQEQEPAVELAVVANPFAAFTGDDGRFDFAGVPAGALLLEAFGPGGTARLEVVLDAGGAASGLRLVLP